MLASECRQIAHVLRRRAQTSATTNATDNSRRIAGPQPQQPIETRPASTKEPSGPSKHFSTFSRIAEKATDRSARRLLGRIGRWVRCRLAVRCTKGAGAAGIIEPHARPRLHALRTIKQKPPKRTSNREPLGLRQAAVARDAFCARSTRVTSRTPKCRWGW
jgi:hypothetical protein